jgi:hypothetical protein
MLPQPLAFNWKKSDFALMRGKEFIELFKVQRNFAKMTKKIKADDNRLPSWFDDANVPSWF